MSVQTGSPDARPSWTAAWVPDWPTAAFWLIAAIGCVFAFVGLSASSWWTDELFSLYIIDHHGGWPEIWRRVMTDTWPPAYYVILYGWSKLFGLSETALRALSAIFAVGAVGVFVVGTRRALSAPARAFAAAFAVSSIYWFEHSQNARAYSLCMLVSAILLTLALSIRRAVRSGEAFPLWRWLALSLVGLLGAFLHFYLLLTTGAVIGFLILTVPSMRLRIALVVSGLTILAADAAFMKVLLSHTLQNLHEMWFGDSPEFFLNQIRNAVKGLVDDYTWVGLLILIVLAVVRAVRRSPPPPQHGGEDSGWLLALSGFVIAGIIAAGIVVSLTLAPSFSDRNLLAASPFAWVAVASLFQAGAPDPRKLWGAALAFLVVLSLALYLPRAQVRLQPRNEEWRASARYVSDLAACKDQPIPVVQPAKFGPHTPFFRDLSERWFFGRYFTGARSQLHAYLPQAFLGRTPAPELDALIGARAHQAGGCPVLGWGVHDLDQFQAAALGDTLARRADVAPARVALLRFEHTRPSGMRSKPAPSGFVWIVLRSPSDAVAPMPRVSILTFPAAKPVAWPVEKKKR